MTTLENRPNAALLVVDVQNGAVAEAYERDVVVANIGRLVEKARREEVPVVWVQHCDEHLAKGSEDWRIVPELTPGDAEPLVEKSYGDSFEASSLETLLADLGVGRLIVVGAHTDACIRSTLHGAFVRGYDATLVSDAHTTKDKTARGHRRRTKSSPTRTCTGTTRPRRGERPGRSRRKTSTSGARPKGVASRVTFPITGPRENRFAASRSVDWAER